MAGTILFKNTASNAQRARYLTNEDNFSTGMKYTNAPLGTGFAKALVNFDLKNDGECLVPRGGFQDVASRIATVVAGKQYIDFCTHHASAAYIQEHDGVDATLCNYHIIGGVTEAGFDLNTAVLVVEYAGNYIQANKSTDVGITGHLLMKPAATTVQGLHIATPNSRDGIHTSLEGNTYVLVNTGSSNKLGVLKIKFNQNRTAITWHVEEVEPTEIQPTQAINYGYNMFKSNPYTFENSITATGGIQLTGVVPYDEQNKLLLTARPGTPIVFRLYYKYPQIDVDNGDKYLVQWEVQDLNNASNPEVIHKVRGSVAYTPGDNIEFAYTPSYTAFSIIVRLYKKSEMEAQDAAWEADTSLQALVTKDDYLTPNRVTTLASYYLTSNNNSSTLNVEAVSYDMGTATGMCTWQQRLVMWGVRNAKSTIFISEINNPGYMPYPNNCEILNSDVICAIPYLSHLLVFTTTSLYKLTIGEDGLSYTSKCVQERLNMQPSDASSVLTVQNMVYFKSGNYYYMVVPNNASATEDTQLAPVSRSIEQMLDNMEDTITAVINEVYNFTTDLRYNPIQLELLDYNTYVANTQVRNVYKLQVEYQSSTGVQRKDIIDVCLNYDTVLRAWTLYTYQATLYRMTVYKPNVTGETIFTHLFINDYVLYSSLVQADPKNPKDSIELTEGAERIFGNWQLIDTGYRDFNEELKKRFREVQFCVNILNNDTLRFNTAFVVDDVDVVPLYRHTVSQCTDPNDVNYGVIFVERELVEGAHTPLLTGFNEWELDTAMFPDATVHKIRYKVSGKGYGGSVKILSKNEVAFELLHINWVYRVMFAR